MGKLWLVFALVLSLLLALPLVSGCAPKAPPVEKVVTYLSLADYTGPIAGLNVPADMGCEDYFKSVNDKGGVDGVKIKFIGVDTRYDVARCVSAYKRYRTEPKLLMVNAIGTGLGKAVAPLSEKDKISQYTPADGEFVARPPGYQFTWGTTYQDAFAAEIDWMVADWKAKGKPGMPKVGFISWDNPYGREPLRGGKEYAEKLGVPLLPPEFYPPGTPDHSVYLTRLAEAGANYVHVGGVDPSPTLVLRDAHKLGLTKTIQFVCDFWGPDDAVGIKLHPEACEGAVVAVYYLRGEDAYKHPLAELATKYRGKSVKEIGGTYVTGMMWAVDYEKALGIALKDVGYEKLDGEAMYKAYQKLTGFDRYGLTGPCTYSPTSRRGSDLMRYYQVKGGKLVSISGWVKAPDAVALHAWGF